MESPRKPIRRALIIGIRYDDSDSAEDHTLIHAHNDARAWMELCIDRYGYNPSDITMMLDHESAPSHLQPTTENIRTQIGKLVENVHNKDELVFYYTGFSAKNHAEYGSNNDDYTTYLLPANTRGAFVDNNNMMISGEELRKILVDPLPVGCSLTAFLDICDTELLNLDHYLCNNVWFPFVVGQADRDCTKTRPFGPPCIRRNAWDLQGVRVKRYANQAFNSCIQVYEQEPQPTEEQALCQIAESQWVLDATTQRCTSPEQMMVCTGDCQKSEIDKAWVVSIETAMHWVSGKKYPGNTATQFALKVLAKNPHPSYTQLVAMLGHEQHTYTQHVKRKMRARATRRNLGYFEFKEYSIPQIGSMEPITSEDYFMKFPLHHSKNNNKDAEGESDDFNDGDPERRQTLPIPVESK